MGPSRDDGSDPSGRSPGATPICAATRAVAAARVPRSGLPGGADRDTAPARHRARSADANQHARQVLRPPPPGRHPTPPARLTAPSENKMARTWPARGHDGGRRGAAGAAPFLERPPGTWKNSDASFCSRRVGDTELEKL